MIQQPDFQILTVWWLSNLSQYLIIIFYPFLKYHVSDPVPGKRSGSAGFILAIYIYIIWYVFIYNIYIYISRYIKQKKQPRHFWDRYARCAVAAFRSHGRCFHRDLLSMLPLPLAAWLMRGGQRGDFLDERMQRLWYKYLSNIRQSQIMQKKFYNTTSIKAIRLYHYAFGNDIPYYPTISRQCPSPSVDSSRCSALCDRVVLRWPSGWVGLENRHGAQTPTIFPLVFINSNDMLWKMKEHDHFKRYIIELETLFSSIQEVDLGYTPLMHKPKYFQISRLDH